jgi:hypothetical protein
LINYLPEFFGGLFILILGLFFSDIVKRIFLTLLDFFQIKKILTRIKILSEDEIKLWQEILAEILKWTIILIFLIPTLEVWGLNRATAVINQFLFYLPNVIIAVILLFIGLIASKLVADLVLQSTKSLGKRSANSLAFFSRSTIIFFTILITLSQLGVAQDLIKILFTGIVAMVAIAGGLAFGLGGKDVAKDILEALHNKLKKD